MGHDFFFFFVCSWCEYLPPSQGGKPRVADFVHGSNGMGDIPLATPKGQKTEKSASEFLVDQVSEHPGMVSILALGPLTNLALVSSRPPVLFPV